MYPPFPWMPPPDPNRDPPWWEWLYVAIAAALLIAVWLLGVFKPVP